MSSCMCSTVCNRARICHLTTGRSNAGTAFTHADIQKEKRALVGVVLDNRRNIQDLRQIEEDRDSRQNLANVIEAKHGLEGADRDVGPDDSASTHGHITTQREMTSSQTTITPESKMGNNTEESKMEKQSDMGNPNPRPDDTLLDPKILARSTSYSSNRGEYLSSTGLERGLTEADELSGPSTSHQRSQSPTSEHFETAPEIPVTESTDSHHSQEDIFTERNPSHISSAKEPISKIRKSQELLSNGNAVIPTAQWFLSFIPHELIGTALVVRPRSRQADRLKALAEATAKTLVLTWTILDADNIFEMDSGGWSRTTSFDSYYPGQARETQNLTQPYQSPFASQPYPTYAPQQWYRPPVFTLPPSTATVNGALSPDPVPPPPLADEKQTDTEELARLKKMILDEKAEQDLRAAALSVVPPIAKQEQLKDTMRCKATYKEAVDPSQALQEHSTLWKLEHPRVQPVIMRDWLGRKFIFPVDMCQTWEVGRPNL